MTGQFGLEAYSGPLDHDDGSDKFIIDQYRSQIDKSPPPPKVLLSTATEWATISAATEQAILDQLEAFAALNAGHMHKPQAIKKNSEFVDRIARKKPAESDNSRKQRDTASMNDITREELDAKIEATNARVEARLAGFEATVRETLAAVRQDSAESRGELKAIHVELSYLKNLKANIWGAAVVTITLVGAILAYGVSSFDSGRDTAQVVQEAKQQTAATQKLLEQIQAQQKALSTPPSPVTAPPAAKQ
ncbi:hypothetical protein [Pseudomonas sp. R45(2017)]|uniref:hypothetical protein n=1 Tax=Pseudomonas sp. R45(2017) TaxID=1981678 RepID=UPI000A1F7968|nr:hypothetical protein [Pseudomonas sp. R45(2017)]